MSETLKELLIGVAGFILGWICDRYVFFRRRP